METVEAADGVPTIFCDVESIFIRIVDPADVEPALERPLSLPGDDKSSGVTGGGDLSGP